MARIYEEISKSTAQSGGKTDANLANDAKNLGGIPAEQYATQKYVKDYHNAKEANQKEYIDKQDQEVLEQAKEFTNSQIRNQDFSGFAKIVDVQALDKKLSGELSEQASSQKTYTDEEIQKVVNDTNTNFQDVQNAIGTLNNNQKDLFQSVSNGKATVAAAITDKGVTTAGDATFDTMATNIRNIQSGSGSMAPGFVNTSDATATASDILNGKTAYVNGEKVYGNLIYTGNNSGEYNPDNPYPEKAEVELVYGEKENDIEVNNIGEISSTIFDISSDKRLLVAYDSTEKKIKTFLRQGDNSYKQEINQNGEYVTPIYSFSDLGITEDSNYSLKKIKMSIMNSEENVSGYECRIAFLFIRTTETEETTTNVITYVYRISTYNGEIKTQNEDIIAGTEGNTSTYIYYNKWKIESQYTGTNSLTVYDLVWSPDTYTLAVIHVPNGTRIEIYQFLNTTKTETENYSQAVKTLQSLSIGSNMWYDTYQDFKFINMDKIILINWTTSYSSYGSRTNRYTIIVLDENFNILKSYNDSASDGTATSSIGGKQAFTNDGLYATGNGALYTVTVNYITGDLTTEEIGTGITGESEQLSFSKDNKYLIKYADGTLSIYATDFVNKTFTLLYTVTSSGDLIRLSALKAFITKPSTYSMIETIIDEKNLIGIKYQGEVFYRNVYNPGRFTAGQPDVRAGKTFIGYMGIPETGTMEVSE